MKMSAIILFFVITTGVMPKPKFKDGQTWKTQFTCADLSTKPYPRLERSRTVPELVSADHFDDILEDTPDFMRPGSIVLFYTRENNVECYEKYLDMHFEYHVKNSLPSRSHLFSAKYDMYNAHKRAWYEWTPERDMNRRFGVKACPTLMYFPRSCNGETQWCTEELEDGGWIAGCEDYVESCPNAKTWGGRGNWVKWVKKQLKKDGEPELNMERFKNFKEQERWIRSREGVTCNTHARNIWITKAMPIFSERGFTIVKIPEGIYKKILDFYHQYRTDRKTPESWEDFGSTQMNYHEVATTLVYLDINPRLRDQIGHMIRPIAEEWVGIKPLELTSFYGIREYYPGSWLRNHVDRIDTHIVSATLSIFKENMTEPWPLEAVDHLGQTVRYTIEPGYMALYESAKVPHGRPYRLKSGIHAGCFLHFRPKDRWPTKGLQNLMEENTVQIHDRTYEMRYRNRKSAKREL